MNLPFFEKNIVTRNSVPQEVETSFIENLLPREEEEVFFFLAFSCFLSCVCFRETSSYEWSEHLTKWTQCRIVRSTFDDVDDADSDDVSVATRALVRFCARAFAIAIATPSTQCRLFMNGAFWSNLHRVRFRSAKTQRFWKVGQSPASNFVYFRLFKQPLQFLQQIYVKNMLYPSIQCWDSNPWSSGHVSIY